MLNVTEEYFIIRYLLLQCYSAWLNLKLRGRSPQANYTDRATAACRRN
jgi:hypothetical protein